MGRIAADYWYVVLFTVAMSSFCWKSSRWYYFQTGSTRRLVVLWNICSTPAICPRWRNWEADWRMFRISMTTTTIWPPSCNNFGLENMRKTVIYETFFRSVFWGRDAPKSWKVCWNRNPYFSNIHRCIVVKKSVNVMYFSCRNIRCPFRKCYKSCLGMLPHWTNEWKTFLLFYFQ